MVISLSLPCPAAELRGVSAGIQKNFLKGGYAGETGGGRGCMVTHG